MHVPVRTLVVLNVMEKPEEEEKEEVWASKIVGMTPFGR